MEKPIRAILQMIPGLKTCKIEHCQCPQWHPSEEDPIEPLLDVWQRDFVSMFFKKTRPKEAAMFTCMLRIKSSILDTIAEASGRSGLYLEARTHDGRGQDPRFHTVWLPKQSFEQAQASQASVEETTSLMRVAHRYGLRVELSKASAIHSKFKPDVPLMCHSCRDPHCQHGWVRFRGDVPARHWWRYSNRGSRQNRSSRLDDHHKVKVCSGMFVQVDHLRFTCTAWITVMC